MFLMFFFKFSHQCFLQLWDLLKVGQGVREGKRRERIGQCMMSLPHNMNFWARH